MSVDKYAALDRFDYSLFDIQHNIFFDSAINDYDMAILYKLLIAAAKQNMQALEIGTWDGKSACFIGNICKVNNGNLYCVDPYFGGNKILPCMSWSEVRRTMLLWHDNINAAQLQYHVFSLKLAAHKLAHILKDQSFDFIFVDGAHRYEWVMADLELYYPKLKPNAIMCGHDYDDEGDHQVKSAVDNFFGSFSKPISCEGRIWWVTA
jgi:predicted O-methyltransferase YrrM